MNTNEAMHSDQMDQLFTALSKAQAMILTAAKDSTNPFFKSKYSDLASVWEACRGPLTSNGLTIIQTIEGSKESMFIVTWLGHSSGQWMKSRLPLMPTKADHQSVGSAISYARRYALSAIAGVVSDDDDGEAAMKHARKQEQKPQPVLPKLETDEQLNEAFAPFAKEYHEEDPELIKKYLRIYSKHWKKTAKETLEDYQDNAKFCLDFMNWKKKNIKD